MNTAVLTIQNLSVTAAHKKLLADVNLEIPTGGVFGLMGASGAGKSTLLKCINRMTELTQGLHVQGDILFHGQSIYRAMDPDSLRNRIGILFQQPVVFPGSILSNVLFGVKHLGKVPKRDWPDHAEQALREAVLWTEVKDRLQHSAAKLSVGQQQRLCLARTLATSPEVILMDEPASALDPASTAAIEELIIRLSESRTIVLVTHSPAQARRCCSLVATVAADESGTGRIVSVAPPE